MTKQDDRLWEDMLAEFRALGGTAENICLKEGAHGRGLFPVDPAKPIRVHIPESLLIDVRHLQLENGRVRIRETAGLGSRVKHFLEDYQQNFAWGVARHNTESLLQMVHEAPLPLRQMLKSPFEMDHLLCGASEGAVFERFFASRTLGHNGGHVVIPVIELANYGTAAGYEYKDGLGLSGTFPGEILVKYERIDPLDTFASWGFASSEPFALSLHVGLRSMAGSILIKRGKLVDRPDRTPFFPDVSMEGDEITLSYMLLGHKKFPRMAKAIFCKIMEDAGRPNPEMAFDEIQHINRMQFHRLMELSEDAAPPLAKLLRTMARYQLEAMSHHIGTRDIEPAREKRTARE